MIRAWCFAFGLLACLTGTIPALAAAGPTPPCAGAPVPSWTGAEAPPAVKVWHPDEVEGWRAPPCSGLSVPPGATLITVAGSFHQTGGLEPVLGRIGAVSHQLKVQRWSARRQTWLPMLEDGSALAGPDADLRRRDFQAADFRPGARLFALYDDAESVGPVVYETLVLTADETSVDLVTRNVVPARLMGFTVAGVGDIATHVALRRGSDDLVRYYALTAVNLASIASAMTPEAAHINRAVATFRYVAGIPSTAEPPAAAG